MKRQAVIVVHGIGQQRPMSTLRGFVDSLCSNEKEWMQDSEQDLTDGYELRKIAVYNGEGLKTDFHEYYWAFKMRGTKLVSVLTWLFQLLWRKPKNIPGRIIGLYLILWTVAIGYGVVLAMIGANWLQRAEWTKLPVTIFIANVLLNVVAIILTLFLGDARYTHAAPGNVKVRNKIKKGGIDLLKRIHESGMYSRVIIVGHSLGSMIAYDILKHYWGQLCREYRDADAVPHHKLDAYNWGSRKGFDLSESDKIRTYMNQQRELLLEQQDRGNPWLVTDLITLGSPLAYGELLMADSKEEFSERKYEGEFPTSPPRKQGDGSISFKRPFFVKENEHILAEVIHNAGHFAFTKWHNLYFGFDYVGGPLQKIFGNGIYDKKLSATSWKAYIPFLMHTKYWGEPRKSKALMKESIDYLKGVIFYDDAQ